MCSLLPSVPHTPLPPINDLHQTVGLLQEGTSDALAGPSPIGSCAQESSLRALHTLWVGTRVLARGCPGGITQGCFWAPNTLCLPVPLHSPLRPLISSLSPKSDLFPSALSLGPRSTQPFHSGFSHFIVGVIFRTRWLISF